MQRHGPCEADEHDTPFNSRAQHTSFWCRCFWDVRSEDSVTHDELFSANELPIGPTRSFTPSAPPWILI